MQKQRYDPTDLPGVFLPKQKPSLCELFSEFLNDSIDIDLTPLSPLMLRLLLYPIQGQVCHMQQLLTCFGTRSKRSRAYGSMSRTSVQLRLEEVQSLLHRWYGLWESTISPEASICSTSQAALVIYHLIRLDTICSFGLIEKTARELPQITVSKSSFSWTTLLQAPQEAVLQAGHVLRLVNAMPKDARPPWWGGAIYRSALILWSYSLTTSLQHAINTTSHHAQEKWRRDKAAEFRIDLVHDGQDIVDRFERCNEGLPTLLDENGTACVLSNPTRTLLLCILFLDNGQPTRFCEGIKAKLLSLSEVET